MLLIAGASLCTGCSSKQAKPTAVDVESVFSSRINAESEGRLKLATITESKEAQAIGGNFRWTIAAEVECTEDGIWLSSGSKELNVPVEFSGPDADADKQRFEQMRRYPIDFRTTAASAAAKDQGSTISAGERFKVVGVLSLSKDHEGWKGVLFTMQKFPRKIQ
jgi:hypothetical protein